jgi:hypothetical protein
MRRIGGGRRDQRDPAAAVMDDLVANTLRTAAGLAKAATGQQQPLRRAAITCPVPLCTDRASIRVRLV